MDVLKYMNDMKNELLQCDKQKDCEECRSKYAEISGNTDFLSCPITDIIKNNDIQKAIVQCDEQKCIECQSKYTDINGNTDSVPCNYIKMRYGVDICNYA